MSLLRFLQTNNSGKRLRSLLLESAMIILSVILGLLANDWRLNRENKATADQTIRAIQQELQSNLQEIEQLLPYRQHMQDSLMDLRNRILQEQHTATALDFARALPKGFSVPLLGSDAWELAKTNGALQEFEFNLAIDLGKIYRAQAFYQQKLDIIGQNMYVAGNITPHNYSATGLAISVLTNDILIQEKKLVELYQSMLKKLDE